MKRFFLFCLFVIGTSSVHAEVIIMPKWTTVEWSSRNFSFGNHDIVFEKSSSTILGVEAGAWFSNNFGVTGEFIFLDYDIASNNNRTNSLEYTNGYANVYHYNAYAKYFLPLSDKFLTYAGLGLGRVNVSVHSDPNPTMSGYSKIANIGFIYRFNSVIGLAADFKSAYMDIKDETATLYRLKTHYNTYQLGVSITF
ncbi:MAG: porin family protein [Gammaproteobacteria bacterium]|nr:porin family protein [Gammaproteobacteria bacterium]